MTMVPEDPAKGYFVCTAFFLPSFNSVLVWFCHFWGRLVVLCSFLNYFSKLIICNFLKNNIINKLQLTLHCLPC